MIARSDIEQRAREWQLPAAAVRRDYLAGWLAASVGADPALRDRWALAGGTGLRKCHIETYRCAPDLQLMVPPGLLARPGQIRSQLQRPFRQVCDATGIDLLGRPAEITPAGTGRVLVGVPYPAVPGRLAGGALRLELRAGGRPARRHRLRSVAHPYPDGPLPGPVRCPGTAELLADALLGLCLPDWPGSLYDAVSLFRRQAHLLDPPAVAALVAGGSAASGAAVPAAADLGGSPLLPGLASQWDGPLAGQLPVVPPLRGFLSELAGLLGWLDGSVRLAALEPIPPGTDDIAWQAPPAAAVWGRPVPIEPVRFAASNRLCVRLEYQDSSRVIEPYALRKAVTGGLLVRAERHDGGGQRSYLADKIQGLAVTRTQFRPRHAIEFAEGDVQAAVAS